MAYELCATPSSVQNALYHLCSSSHLFVDLEGRDLGCEGGALSVISIGTVVARKTYLFDVLSLARRDLEPVLDLLANSHTLKIVWDGRMDAVELQRTFGIALGRVLDLQIADILSRPARGAEDELRKHRAWHPLHAVAHLDTDGVHALTGLKNALTSHGVYDDARPTTKAIFNHKEWMTRPLPSAYLDYAAKDIALLARVYTVFQTRGHVTNRNRHLPELEVQSRRYINLHDAPIPSNDMYRSSNLLPLEILSLPAGGATAECVKCHRMLSPASFTYYDEAKTRRLEVHETCKVCYLLCERAALQQALPTPPVGNAYLLSYYVFRGAPDRDDEDDDDDHSDNYADEDHYIDDSLDECDYSYDSD